MRNPVQGAASGAELTAMLALSMALAALGIDLLLPAFADIRAALRLPADSTAVAGLVTAYFLGLAVGQLLYGPLADRFGRRPALYLGYGVYLVGALAAVVAPTLPLLLASRFVWGLGAGGPRVVTLAVVRDRYSGDHMARTMSFIMAVFILVPVFAPTVGAGIVAVAPWRWVFGCCAVVAAAVALWALRMPETLRPEHRAELRARRVARAARFVVSNRRTSGYMLAMTALYGVFTSYLGSAEIIFSDTFDAADAFPLLFGVVAAAMGAAMLANARVVQRIGTARLAHTVMIAYLVLAGGLVAVAVITAGRPPLWLFVVGLMAMLSAHALLIPNFNTLAMQPMAAVAGTASSVIGSVQLAAGAGLGALIDRTFDGTVLPLSTGFLGCGVLSAAFLLWAERGRLTLGPGDAPSVADAAAAVGDR